jgi:hypothetical protein
MTSRYATRQKRQFCFFTTIVCVDLHIWPKAFIRFDRCPSFLLARRNHMSFWRVARQSQRPHKMSKILILHVLAKGGCAMSDELARGERLQVMLTGDELMLLDDFRYKARMPSRASAVRELLKRGLTAKGFESAAFGTKSEDFGITGKIPPGRKRR